MFRVLLIDDHAVVRKGAKAILEDQLAGVSVAEAGSGEEALTTLGARPFDVVVLDLSMPGRSGIDLLAEVKHRFPRLPVLIMSLHDEEQFALRALRAGAAGYLSKAVAPEQLVAAVVKVANGGRYVSEALADRLAGEASGQAAPGARHEKLSDREFEVLRGIAGGQSVGQLAEQMHLSVKTISTYRKRLLDKMGLGSNAELTRYALEHGLL